MPRPDPATVPVYFNRYINQAPGNDINKVLQEQSKELFRFLSRIPEGKRNYRYAKGKWTIREVLQHMIDTERVFAYRALCFSRQDQTPLPSFDENLYAANANASKREWKDLIEEFKAVRRSTEILYQSFSKKQLNSFGTASNHPISVQAIGFIVAGHVNHHLSVLKERYLA